MEKLARDLTLFDLVFYGVGIIVGAGIYALIGPATALAGNAVWMAFVVGAFIAACTGLSFAELVSMYPEDAAEFVYVKHALRNDLVAFLVGWTTIFVVIFGVATVATGFGQYFTSLFPLFNEKVWAAVIILVMTGINVWGIDECARCNEVLTSATIGGLLFLFVIGIGSIGSVDYFDMPNGIEGIVGAAALVFFAYLGFDEIVNAAEEAKDARKMIPKAILLSVLISAIFYIFIALAAVSLADWRTIGASSTPLRTAASTVLPEAGIFLAMIAVMTTAGTTLIALVSGSRMIYGMAKKRELPKIFSRIMKGEHTPAFAALAIGLLAFCAVFLEGLAYLASVTTLGAFTTFAFVNLSVIVLRFREPHTRREFHIPVNIGKVPVFPLLGLASCLYMLSTLKPSLWVVMGGVALTGTAVHYLFEKK